MGQGAAGLLRPTVSPRVCKALVAFLFLGWFCLLAIAATTTRLLLDKIRILAPPFYGCCVFGPPSIPYAIDIFLGAVAFVASRRAKAQRTQETFKPERLCALHRTPKMVCTCFAKTNAADGCVPSNLGAKAEPIEVHCEQFQGRRSSATHCC